MEVLKTPLAGALLVRCRKFSDGRGFFAERFRENILAEAGIPVHYKQENFSRSAARVLRGVHYQYTPAQGKLVTCMHGRIWDVIVDIRKGSKTLGQHFGVELDGENPTWLWIPPGFAHGFCVLSEEPADLYYKVTEYYNKVGEEGILWNDSDLQIPWPLNNPVLSDRDQLGLTFSDYKKNFRF